jgi:hypothetical protein
MIAHPSHQSLGSASDLLPEQSGTPSLADPSYKLYDIKAKQNYDDAQPDNYQHHAQQQQHSQFHQKHDLHQHHFVAQTLDGRNGPSGNEMLTNQNLYHPGYLTSATSHTSYLIQHLFAKGLVGGLFADTVLCVASPKFAKVYPLHAIVLSRDPSFHSHLMMLRSMTTGNHDASTGMDMSDFP